MNEVNINLGLTSFVDRALGATPEFDKASVNSVIPFGVSFLDRTMYGISNDDLVLIGAPPGVGKTELAASIAINAAYLGKRVVCFALEATEGEWEQRTKYRLYLNCHQKLHGLTAISGMNYQDFDLGMYSDLLAPYREAVESTIKQMPMQMYYRERDFGIKEFTRVFNAINDKCDLLVVDHLHYFDTDDENENRAIASIMKKIRDMNQITKIPVVLVGHLRKRDRKDGVLIPSLEDFHGTSEIGKIASKVITLSSGGVVSEGRFHTYFRIPKCRKAGFVTRYVARGVFNAMLNEYESEFVLGTLSADEKQFQAFSDIKQVPSWYRQRGKA